jgi:Trk K+ transport system NAD-binding subunit
MLAQIHTKTAGGYAILSNIPNIIGVSMLVSSESGFAGKRVLEASFPDWMRIAFIQRLNTNGTWESLRPSLDKTLLEGDRLIIFCSPERVVELEKRFKV